MTETEVESRVITMKEQMRSQLLKTISRLAGKYPELRIGQILGNAIHGDLYYINDDVLLKTLLEYEYKTEEK